jgi:glycosyltransferase involved in cell wall biosynthesis
MQSVSHSDSRIMIFELGYLGHYPSYIRSLARYWCQHNLSGSLDIVISPNFKTHHPDVLAIASECYQKNLNFLVITEAEQAQLTPRNSPLNRARRSLQEWNLLQNYASLRDATHCLLLYFDSFQTAVASGQKSSCLFSGIYFRPTFHYSTFPGHQPSRKETIQHWRERLILPRILNHSKLANLFCLDPYVVPHMTQFGDHNKARYLPDPVEITNVSEEAVTIFKQRLGIEPDRYIFLLFGALYDPRKGLHQILDALEVLSAEQCAQLCLLLVGTTGGNEALKARIILLQQQLPVQILLQDQFVPADDIQFYFRSSDVILATYQRHVGMSGILVQAAAAQRPLLSSDYGLMGETTRRWNLGITIDATSSTEIAMGITRFLKEDPASLGDRIQMQAFAQQNSAHNFAATIFQSVVS